MRRRARKKDFAHHRLLYFYCMMKLVSTKLQMWQFPSTMKVSVVMALLTPSLLAQEIEIPLPESNS